MKYVWLACLLWGGILFAASKDAGSNVNVRYRVDAVIVSGDGWTMDFLPGAEKAAPAKKISAGMRKRLAALVGGYFDPSALDDLASRLKKEFRAGTVSHRVARGGNPENVRVFFEISDRSKSFDVSVPKFLYQSNQGWSGSVEASGSSGRNKITLGLVSDGDEFAERYAGLLARYENKRLGSDRIRFGFEFDSYHEQWNSATLAQFAQPEALAPRTYSPYRSRRNLEPSITFAISSPLTVTAGASFQSFQTQQPEPRGLAANAAFAGIQYHASSEGPRAQQDIQAGYSLRAATAILGSDLAYVRHYCRAQYTLGFGKSGITDEVSAGAITGAAPLFERYYLGNSSTLRGWSKFEIDPTGGNRMVHNSVEYRYGALDVFYDAGAIWDDGQPATVRHGVGVGVRHGPFALAVAFPVRGGRADPIFMMGMNY